MKVFLVKLDGGHLVPQTAVDAEELLKFKDKVLEIRPQPVDEQRGKLLRRAFKLAKVFLDHFPDPIWSDAQEVIDAVKKRAGLVIPSNDLNGKFYVRLVSTADMNREQVKHLHDKTVQLLSDLLGSPIEDLLEPLREAAERKPRAQPAAGDAKPAAGPVTPPNRIGAEDFLRQMLEVVKRDPEVPKTDKAKILRNAAPLWHEQLGPGYVDMVNAVVRQLAEAMDGKCPVEDAIRYADSKVRYWSPNKRGPHA